MKKGWKNYDKFQSRRHSNAVKYGRAGGKYASCKPAKRFKSGVSTTDFGFSKEHLEHIKGGYFQKGCSECAKFIGDYSMSGRKFKDTDGDGVPDKKLSVSIEPVYVARGRGNDANAGERDLLYKIKEWGYVFPTKEDAEKYANEHVEFNGTILEKAKMKYNTMSRIGKAKYVVSYYSGGINPDGSDFYDIRIFKNKNDLAKFQRELVSKGYKGE